MGTIGRSVIVVAALGWAAAAARAESGPVLRVAGLAPFSEAELEEALRLRLGGDHQVDVMSAPGGITITVDGRSRSIVLGDERGVEAARVVALVAAAIVIDEAQDRRRVGMSPGPVVDEDSHARPEIDRPPPAWRWSLGPLETRAAGERTRLGAGVWLSYDRDGSPGDGIRALAAIGVTMSTIELAAPAPELRTIEVPVRVGAWLGDRFAVGATAVAVPYVTSGGAGDHNVLLGAGVMARAQMAIPIVDGGRGGLVLMAGVDGMASSVEYRWEGQPVLASGRVRPWFALGVTWEGGP